MLYIDSKMSHAQTEGYTDVQTNGEEGNLIGLLKFFKIMKMD
jgi:hypothetical protein